MKTIQSRICLATLIMSIFFICGCSSREKRVEVKKAKVGDVELAYYTRGSGEPLVMLMGFRGTMAMWDPALLEILENKYQLILFDHRGVGLSSDTPNNLTTIPQMAEDTVNLIKYLGLQKVHILGWSMGSRIAIEMGLKFPEMADCMILCSPNPGGKFQEARKSHAYTDLTSPELDEQQVLSLIFPATKEGESAAIGFAMRTADAIISGRVPNDIQISTQTIERQVEALKQWDEDDHYYEDLSNIKVPTLVTGGLKDELDSPKNVSKVACRIPFAWSAYFPHAGHAFLSQNYQHFAELVTLFIESNKK
ncbi:hypothetical protein DB43_EF00070 [Parachlamydia acanthamoebae]|jgi:pimeloyl-ACP methyl ester carboxylesterase|nr:hypothetical protein DB43_EF00070 [Parachlamydia acanthamoebae]